MFKTLFIISLFSLLPCAFGQRNKKKIIYKYKRFEKFDFDDLNVIGDEKAAGDLSITPRSQFRFKNKLPYRKNFNLEVRKGVERVR